MEEKVELLEVYEHHAEHDQVEKSQLQNYEAYVDVYQHHHKCKKPQS